MNPMQQMPGQQPWMMPQQPAQASQPLMPQATTVTPQINPGQWQVGGAQDAGGNGLAMAHLLGRTVAIVPRKLLKDQPVRNQPGAVQDVLEADVLILDGPTPFTFGGSPQGKPMPTPDTMAVDTLPFLVPGNSRIFGKVIVSQITPKIGTGIVVGKIVMQPTGSGNNAYQITTDPAPELVGFVQQWAVDHYQNKTWANPPVRMLAGPQAQQQGPAYGPPQTLGGQAYQIQPQIQSPAPQFPAFQPPAMPAPAQMVDWTLNTMPPGVPAEQLTAWQSQTTREQREQMLAAAGITGPNVAPGQPTGL